MINSQTFDLDSVRANEARIFEHIGRLTVEVTHIDQRLSVLLAWMTGAPDRNAAQKIFEGEQIGTKVRLLKRALPDDWADKKRLLKALNDVQDYRNSLAHSTVQTLLNYQTGDVVYSKNREHRDSQPEQIDLDLLKIWETRASMLRLGLLLLTEYHSRTSDIVDADLRTLILDVMTEPTADHSAAIDFILPPLK